MNESLIDGPTMPNTAYGYMHKGEVTMSFQSYQQYHNMLTFRLNKGKTRRRRIEQLNAKQ